MEHRIDLSQLVNVMPEAKRPAVPDVEMMSPKACRDLMGNLNDYWVNLARNHPEFNTHASNILLDPAKLKLLKNSVSVTSRTTTDVDELYKIYVIQAITLLAVVMDVDAAKRFLDLDDVTAVSAMMDTIEYVHHPTASSVLHNNVQAITLGNVVTKLAMFSYPSRFIHGCIQILAEFEVAEELLEKVVVEIYRCSMNPGARETIQ